MATWLRWLSPNSGHSSMWHSVDSEGMTCCGHEARYLDMFEYAGDAAPHDEYPTCLLCTRAVEKAARKREKLERIESEPRKGMRSP